MTVLLIFLLGTVTGHKTISDQTWKNFKPLSNSMDTINGLDMIIENEA